MKFSGKKWHLVWSYGYSLGGCRSWCACHKITKPMKGGHTHNHCSNRELRCIHTAKERKWLRKFLKKEL